MSNISRKIQADKGMTGGVSHFKAADWSKGFVCKFIFSLTSYSVESGWNPLDAGYVAFAITFTVTTIFNWLTKK